MSDEKCNATVEIMDVLTKAIAFYREKHPRDVDEPFPYLQEACEALAQVLGFFEGVACLGGISAEDREKLRLIHIRLGKQSALKSHQATTCKGCDGSKHLQMELEAS